MMREQDLEMHVHIDGQKNEKDFGYIKKKLLAPKTS